MTPPHGRGNLEQEMHQTHPIPKISTETTTLGNAHSLVLVRKFFAEHAEALLNACYLLGGQAARCRCLQLISDLSETSILTRRLKGELVALHQLLALEKVSDPEAVEAGCFAAIDLEDPIVMDICLLTDGVFDLLGDLGAGDRTPSEEAMVGWLNNQAA